MTERLYQITMRSCCFGVVVKNGEIVFIAPIMKWALGKTWQFFIHWIKSKGGKIVMVSETITEDGPQKKPLWR